MGLGILLFISCFAPFVVISFRLASFRFVSHLFSVSFCFKNQIKAKQNDMKIRCHPPIHPPIHQSIHPSIHPPIIRRCCFTVKMPRLHPIGSQHQYNPQYKHHCCHRITRGYASDCNAWLISRPVQTSFLHWRFTVLFVLLSFLVCFA